MVRNDRHGTPTSHSLKGGYGPTSLFDLNTNYQFKHLYKFGLVQWHQNQTPNSKGPMRDSHLKVGKKQLLQRVSAFSGP
ncbi:unnamed protein product [Sphenostylis stenocarpa]|uniref:Uncharacterized protein n=1 Tax=Sphenostylis stenocarpa TaxID=92480 RepID=A0AA86VYE6_9FABA|nr:unnamed protein product [Sphenostylis stenocarpa]